MVSGRDGPYHRPYLGDTQSKGIDGIPTSGAIIPALGLGVAQVLATLYNIVRHSVEMLPDLACPDIDDVIDVQKI